MSLSCLCLPVTIHSAVAISFKTQLNLHDPAVLLESRFKAGDREIQDRPVMGKKSREILELYPREKKKKKKKTGSWIQKGDNLNEKTKSMTRRVG